MKSAIASKLAHARHALAHDGAHVAIAIVRTLASGAALRDALHDAKHTLADVALVGVAFALPSLARRAIDSVRRSKRSGSAAGSTAARQHDERHDEHEHEHEHDDDAASASWRGYADDEAASTFRGTLFPRHRR